MPSKLSSCVIGIDVGGTNTDSVVLQGQTVLAWHKTPTTGDIQEGVEKAIEAVVEGAKILPSDVGSVKIGTTQFVNAVLEKDSSKLDKVAVIRLCGPYSRGSPPFVDFPPKLRELMEGHYGYVDGGFQVDGTPILSLNHDQLKEQAELIRLKRVTSIVVVGIYSPSDSAQEIEARDILQRELGQDYDISCSHAIGRLGFLERENASILNASLRRFARHVIAGFVYAVQKLGKCRLYITLNDGTLSKASTAAETPVRCFSSGPTNSARGAAFLADSTSLRQSVDDQEILVVDIGGTSTDICALLTSGYPRQSAAYVKIAGVRTNFTIPDVKSIPLGGGSLVRQEQRTYVGSKSVGSKLLQDSIFFGGDTLTATDLVFENERTERLVSLEIKKSGLDEIARALEEAIDIVKTKQGDAKVILVGGGSILVGKHINGVCELIRPTYHEVANAVGAAMGKIGGSVDKTVIVGEAGIDREKEVAKALAIERCVAAGGRRSTIEVVEVDVVPCSYITNGATRIFVRVMGDLSENSEEPLDDPDELLRGEVFQRANLVSTGAPTHIAEISYDIVDHIDIEAYRPKLEGDLWHLSELDLRFLLDGAGVLGVGSCGEPYPSYLACLLALRAGGKFTIMRQDTIRDDAVVLVTGFMGSPSVYQERIPGTTEVADAMREVMKATNLSDFDAVIPNEIGGLNAFEALLAAHRFGKSTLDTDCVARAYPMVWQTVRCLAGIPVAPSAVANGMGDQRVFVNSENNNTTEDLMRNASTELGNLAGMCVNPVFGKEARTLPANSFSHAWTIGRSIALSRALKTDPIPPLLAAENGVLLFSGKIISVTRNVAKGFTRGHVILSPFGESAQSTPVSLLLKAITLRVDFENENLCAKLIARPVALEGSDDGTGDVEEKILACCPDLITFLDIANGAPLGIDDYKYGLRVSVIALKAPPIWLTETGLEMGGPRAFGLDMDYRSVSIGEYEKPKSVWELRGEVS